VIVHSPALNPNDSLSLRRLAAGQLLELFRIMVIS
jgi:hypothetical protein